MRTKEQYISDLKNMRSNIYYKGEVITREHDVLRESISVLGQTFDAAQNRETTDLCTVRSHLNNEIINRFCHIHQSKEDLHKKQDMTRMLCRKVGYCIGRCMGVDAINAINALLDGCQQRVDMPATTLVHTCWHMISTRSPDAPATLHWVRGHVGNPSNKATDVAARDTLPLMHMPTPNKFA